jgi:hypothetical protein
LERAIARHRAPSRFRRHTATGALLRRVARKLDGQDRGLRGLVPEIRARGLGPSALLGFVRDWRDDGQLIMSPDPGKRSRLRICLLSDLSEALAAHLLDRHRKVGRIPPGRDRQAGGTSARPPPAPRGWRAAGDPRAGSRAAARQVRPTAAASGSTGSVPPGPTRATAASSASTTAATAASSRDRRCRPSRQRRVGATRTSRVPAGQPAHHLTHWCR